VFAGRIHNTVPDITGVTILSDSTGFFSGSPSRVFFDSEKIFVNFQGLNFVGQVNPTIVLGVTTIPEPTSISLFGMMAVGVLLGWRHRKPVAAVRAPASN
jgi:hypothetical protein